MSKFDLDDLLSDLGLPSKNEEQNADAASNGGSKEPLEEQATPNTIVSSDPETDHTATPEQDITLTDESDQNSISSADTPETEIETDSLDTISHSSNDSQTENGAFIRSDPEIIPRPPDSTGGGLSESISMEGVTTSNDPNRIRPTDALSMIWSPEEDGTISESADRVDKLTRMANDLLAAGVISADRLENAKRVIRQTPGKSLAATLIEMGADEAEVQKIVAKINGIPFERIDPEEGFDDKKLRALGSEFCKTHLVMPLRREGKTQVIGSTSPGDVFLLDEIRRKLKTESIQHVLVTASDIRFLLEMKDENETDDEGLEDILADIAEDDVEIVEDKDDDDDLEKEAGESPVIRYVNYIIQNALKEGASDIHIEPGETKIKVRFRIDGVLFERMNPIQKMHAAIISRLKIMADLDISERRLPQDGRIRAVVNNRKLDLRVSTLPTVAGEKCVIRILDSRSISVGLDKLGFSDDTLTIWQGQINNPHGIILVTGPTGSGKTTTLYSSIRQMDMARLNISTVEDPVEYHLANITQVQMHEKIGLTFAASLRSLLRQDPDVVMVGEIRDSETAVIAVQAALTGHLVLSTLHTNDAPASITRLINIGVEPFLIGAALNSVLAQRLVRKLCIHCKKEMAPSEDVQEFLLMTGNQSEKIYDGLGCPKCHQTGYSGRLGIYELLVLDDVTRDAIARNPNVTEFRRMCTERGMVTLRQDGLQKVADGITTVEEILRVTEATI